jgi:hypothetical protein
MTKYRSIYACIMIILFLGFGSLYAVYFGEITQINSSVSDIFILDTRDVKSPTFDLINFGMSDNFNFDTRNPPGDIFTGFGVSDFFSVDTRGAFSRIVLGSEEIDYHEVVVGDTLLFNLNIANEGNQILAITGINTDFPQFQIIPISTTIAPADTATISIIFKPTTDDSLESVLRISSNDNNNPRISIPIKGKGISPIIEFSGDKVTFDPIFIGETGTASVSISNSGEAPLYILDMSLINGAAFDIISPVSNDTIPPSEELNISLSYSPTEERSSLDTLTIATNDLEQPILRIPLLGQRAASAALRVADSLDFGVLTEGEDMEAYLLLTSVGEDTLVIGDIEIDGDLFSYLSTENSFEIAPGDSIGLTLLCSGLEVGESEGMLILQTNIATQSSMEIPLSAAVVNKSPVSFDFNIADGDQGEIIAGNAVLGKVYDIEFNIQDAPEINGWSATIEFDPTQIRYVSGSFQASTFIPGLIALADEKTGSLGIGGTVLGSDSQNSGDGSLGKLSFEVLEEFSESTDIVLTMLTFRRLDGIEDKREVYSVATITSELMVTLSGDFNGDGKVDFSDFFSFADAFGGNDPFYDLDDDGSVGFSDFFILADNFGKEERAKLIALAHEHIGLPLSAQLNQNFPNPFNSSTTIKYQIVQPEVVQLYVFDLAGQKVRSLDNSFKEEGNYSVSWDGKDQFGRQVSTGVYFVTLQTKGFTDSKKMTLMK